MILLNAKVAQLLENDLSDVWTALVAVVVFLGCLLLAAVGWLKQDEKNGNW